MFKPKKKTWNLEKLKGFVLFFTILFVSSDTHKDSAFPVPCSYKPTPFNDMYYELTKCIGRNKQNFKTNLMIITLTQTHFWGRRRARWLGCGTACSQALLVRCCWLCWSRPASRSASIDNCAPPTRLSPRSGMSCLTHPWHK